MGMNIIIAPSPTLATEYGRIIGGMSWPTEKSGWAVVVGEERLPRMGGKVRHCHLLAEATEFGKIPFLAQVGDLQAMYRTAGFYGRHDPHNIVHLYMHNSTAAKRGQEPIDFLSAPYADSGRLEVYADMIIGRLSPLTKSLHLGTPEIAKHLVISPEERTTATSASHPAVAALGYALAIIELHSPPPDGDELALVEDDIDTTTGY